MSVDYVQSNRVPFFRTWPFFSSNLLIFIYYYFRVRLG